MFFLFLFFFSHGCEGARFCVARKKPNTCPSYFPLNAKQTGCPKKFKRQTLKKHREPQKSPGFPQKNRPPKTAQRAKPEAPLCGSVGSAGLSEAEWRRWVPTPRGPRCRQSSAPSPRRTRSCCRRRRRGPPVGGGGWVGWGGGVGWGCGVGGGVGGWGHGEGGYGGRSVFFSAFWAARAYRLFLGEWVGFPLVGLDCWFGGQVQSPKPPNEVRSLVRMGTTLTLPMSITV